MGTPAGFVLVGLLFFCLHHSCFGSVVCEATKGKAVTTFSNTAEMIKFPCKYNAIRDLQCGNWSITLSPGNMLESQRNKKYVVKTIYLSTKHISNGNTWYGRSDLKIARKYLAGLEDAPFRKKDGNVDTAEVFDYGDKNAINMVSLIEKNKEFKITFGLYEPFGAWHHSSGFRFECFSSTFIPSGYPTQLCGNGTSWEVKHYKRSKGWKGNRLITLFRNVFANVNINQTDVHCIAAAKSMQEDCKTEDDQYAATERCWEVLGKGKLQQCYSSHGDNPIEVFKDCVQYMCTGQEVPCENLAEMLDLCPRLGTVSGVVRNTCLPTLATT